MSTDSTSENKTAAVTDITMRDINGDPLGLDLEKLKLDARVELYDELIFIFDGNRGITECLESFKNRELGL